MFKVVSLNCNSFYISTILCNWWCIPYRLCRVFVAGNETPYAISYFYVVKHQTELTNGYIVWMYAAAGFMQSGGSLISDYLAHLWNNSGVLILGLLLSTLSIVLTGTWSCSIETHWMIWYACDASYLFHLCETCRIEFALESICLHPLSRLSFGIWPRHLLPLTFAKVVPCEYY